MNGSRVKKKIATDLIYGAKSERDVTEEFVCRVSRSAGSRASPAARGGGWDVPQRGLPIGWNPTTDTYDFIITIDDVLHLKYRICSGG